MKTIAEDYDSNMKLYYNSLKEEREVKIGQEMSPLNSALERCFNKIDAGVVRLNEVNEADASSLDLYAVKVDRSGLQQDIQELLANIQKASLSVDTKEMGERADRILTRTDSVLRASEILMSKSESKRLIKTSSQNSEEIVTQMEVHIAWDNDIELESAAHSLPHKLKASNDKVGEDTDKLKASNDKVGKDTGEGKLEPEYCKQGNAGGNVFKDTAHLIKRIDLPDFYGDRKQWPEFKAMFKHFAEASF